MDRTNTELNPVQPTRAERVLTWLAITAFFTMAIIVTTNVISRWIGRAIIPDDIMLVKELMVLVILLPIGLVTALRQHISVDLFTEWLPRKGKICLALLEHCVGLLFVGLLTWAAWKGAVQAWQTQDYYAGVLDIPMWIGHFTFLFGVALFLIRLILMVFHDLRSLS